MIINHEKKFGCIHIQRTGGKSLNAAIRIVASESRIEENNALAHIPLWVILRDNPEVADYKWYCGIRWPWEIMESEYVLIQHLVEKGFAKKDEDEDFVKFLEYTLEGDFTTFIERTYFGTKRPLAKGGFWKSFCCIKGEEVGVKPLRLSHYQEDFDKMCEEVGMETTPLLKLNQIEKERPQWNPETLKQVMRFCYYDMLESFH